MQINAIRSRTNGFATQSFAFGGEEGPDAFDAKRYYRSGLTNYLIDTGEEVILVDTGIPAGTPEEVLDDKTMIYTGNDISSYMEAFRALGYKPEQVTKILPTHKHIDHSGELKSFPNAKIYVNRAEADAQELQGIDNIIPVDFTDGSYYNFPESQIITDKIRYIKATGHTKGNSLIIAEDEGLFYMMHGDITYVDEALYENKLSIVYEDLKAARETFDRVRVFVSEHLTVYLSTHTPQGPENLESKRVVDLSNPPETIPPGEITFKTASGKYVCSICGYVYDPAVGDPDRGIPPGTPFEELPDDWVCPRCKKPKTYYNRA